MIKESAPNIIEAFLIISIYLSIALSETGTLKKYKANKINNTETFSLNMIFMF